MADLALWWRIRRMMHRCDTPDFPALGQQWTCPECGTRWYVDQWHEEDLVDMGGAPADVGSDYVGWVRL